VRKTALASRRGAKPVGNSPPELAAVIAADTARWAKVIKDAKIELRAVTQFPLRLTHRQVVIAGLDPAIHLLRNKHVAKKMDPRVKPAGDASGG
jgi:malonyl CoA-acyl carrier protein transacylase